MLRYSWALIMPRSRFLHLRLNSLTTWTFLIKALNTDVSVSFLFEVFDLTSPTSKVRITSRLTTPRQTECIYSADILWMKLKFSKLKKWETPLNPFFSCLSRSSFLLILFTVYLIKSFVLSKPFIVENGQANCLFLAAALISFSSSFFRFSRIHWSSCILWSSFSFDETDPGECFRNSIVFSILFLCVSYFFLIPSWFAAASKSLTSTALASQYSQA